MSELLRIRMHRGYLADSMATAREIPRTDAAVRAYLLERVGYLPRPPHTFPIVVHGYGGVDERTGWNTYLVEADGFPVAWTDGLWPGAQRRKGK